MALQPTICPICNGPMLRVIDVTSGSLFKAECPRCEGHPNAERIKLESAVDELAAAIDIEDLREIVKTMRNMDLTVIARMTDTDKMMDKLS